MVRGFSMYQGMITKPECRTAQPVAHTPQVQAPPRSPCHDITQLQWLPLWVLAKGALAVSMSPIPNYAMFEIAMAGSRPIGTVRRVSFKRISA